MVVICVPLRGTASFHFEPRWQSATLPFVRPEAMLPLGVARVRNCVPWVLWRFLGRLCVFSLLVRRSNAKESHVQNTMSHNNVVGDH